MVLAKFCVYRSYAVMNWSGVRAKINGLGRVRCEPGWRLNWISPGFLTDCDLWFVWAGRGWMKFMDGQTIELRPGICVWMRPGRTYMAGHDPDDRLGVSYVHFDLLRRDGRKVGTPGLPSEVHDVRDVFWVDCALSRVVQLLAEETDEACARLEAETILLSLLISLSMPAKSGLAPLADAEHRKKIHRIAAAISEDVTLVPSVAELARSNGYSVAHFSRVFTRVMGRSPRAFIIETRIRRARHLLTESSLGVGEISNQLGYVDVFFFSRQFKKQTGFSPLAFRKR